MEIENVLEINQIKEKLQAYCYTAEAKQRAILLKPFMSEIDLIVAQRETSEARKIIEAYGNPPLSAMENVDEYLNIAQMGGCLTPDQLEHIASILTCVRRLIDYLEKTKQLPLGLPYYAENLNPMEEVREEVNRIIHNGKVDDYASKNLQYCRKEIERLQEKIREKAENVIRTQKVYMADNFITMKNGHICVPMKKEAKGKVVGSIIDKSSTGNTLFIEPFAVLKLVEELQMVQLEEENEVLRILYTLTALLADSESIFQENQRMMEKLDFIFAKGKLSLDLEGVEPEITRERKIVIEDGRHPLMNKKICVPLQFSIGEYEKGVIITGPNTGGKTVAIKTVGINNYMAQCGLHVACKKAIFCMHNKILCDIGDNQNIAENLSTFSAHISNILSILKEINQDSLVILDELGSGTDPTEGMGIAIAVLEELRKSGALFLVTTHYPEVKTYGETTPEISNARMAFHRESLKPLYQLEMGKSGESCAFYIAKKLGMPKNMLTCASMAAYGSVAQFIQQIPNVQENSLPKYVGKIDKIKKETHKQEAALIFKRGDSVMIYPDKKIGIVCQEANDKGVLQVQMANKKIYINYKRVKMQVSAKQLYPENYDFSIIFDSVEIRKARHQMNRKYVEKLEIHLD